MKKTKIDLSSDVIQNLFNKIVLAIKSQHMEKNITEKEKVSFPGIEGEGLLLILQLEGIMNFSCSAIIAKKDTTLELKLFAIGDPETYFITEKSPKKNLFSKLHYRQNSPHLLSFRYGDGDKEYFIDTQIPGHHPHVQHLDIFVRNMQISLLQIIRSTIPVRYQKPRF